MPIGQKGVRLARATSRIALPSCQRERNISIEPWLTTQEVGDTAQSNHS